MGSSCGIVVNLTFAEVAFILVFLAVWQNNLSYAMSGGGEVAPITIILLSICCQSTKIEVPFPSNSMGHGPESVIRCSHVIQQVATSPTDWGVEFSFYLWIVSTFLGPYWPGKELHARLRCGLGDQGSWMKFQEHQRSMGGAVRMCSWKFSKT